VEGRQHVIDWKEDDYAVVDDQTVVGRIYRDRLAGGLQWCCFLNTTPAPPPNNGSADTLDVAKVEFANRYKAVRSQWRRPQSVAKGGYGRRAAISERHRRGCRRKRRKSTSAKFNLQDTKR